MNNYKNNPRVFASIITSVSNQFISKNIIYYVCTTYISLVVGKIIVTSLITEDQSISPAPTTAPKVLKGEGNVYVRLEQQDSICTTKYSQIGEYPMNVN